MATEMTICCLIPVLAGTALLGACSREPPPTTVDEFLQDPIVLEAAVVRCGQDRDRTRYDAECVNARQAISIMEAKEDRARSKEFEEQSERKREALRRTQEAAAEARRRAEEEVRRRQEAEYLAQFGALHPDSEEPATTLPSGENAPGAVISPPPAQSPADPQSADSNAPIAEAAGPADLGAIREELQRRSGASAEESGQ